MHRRRLGFVLCTVGVVTALAVPLGGTAGAVVTACTTGQYPNAPGAQSALKSACTFLGAAVSNVPIIHDFPNAQWHNGAARKITPAAITALGVVTAGAVQAHFSAADVNRGISGPGIPVGSFIKTFTNAGSVTIAWTTVAPPVAGTLKTFLVENSTARRLLDATTTLGSFAMHSMKGNLKPSDVGKSIAGDNIQHATTIATVNVNAMDFTISKTAIATGAAQEVAIGETSVSSTTRQITDGVFATAPNRITSATANYTADDIGLPVTGLGITAGAWISAVTPTVATITGAVLVAGVGKTVVIGVPTVTAPADGDTASALGAELELNPVYVSSDPCAAGTPEGFTTSGQWFNPGSFTGTLAFATPVSGAIGEIAYPTAVVTFGAFVVPRKAATVGDPQAAVHVDVVFPFLPTALGACPGKNLGSTYRFDGSTVSQQKLAQGTGKPGSSSLRSIKDQTLASVISMATIRSAAPVWTFSTPCTTTFPDVVGGTCGNG